MENGSVSKFSISRGLVAVLVASLLVLVSPPNVQSKADYTTFRTYTNDADIIYNNQECDLGDPNDHSTSETAFVISNADQLWEITDCVTTSASVIHFEFANDIDVSQAIYAPTNSPIGFSTSALAYSFSGVLDGKTNLIHGISMSTSSYGVGLFAYLHNATVSNLVITGGFETTTTENVNKSHATGALAIRAEGSLSLTSVKSEANVTGRMWVGGLVGYANNGVTVLSSQNEGSITGLDQVGGLVGSSFGDVAFISSSNSGTVSGAVINSDHGGGLVGYVQTNAYFQSSFNEGAISGSGSYFGGLVGEVRGTTTINSSKNRGLVSASNLVGGLVGSTHDIVNIVGSNNEGLIQASSDNVGGLVGLANNVSIFNSSNNSGQVLSSGDKVGGLLGYAYLDVTITSSHNTATVSGAAGVGGLLGYAYYSAFISSSHNTGNIVGSGDSVGGLAGYVYDYVFVSWSHNAAMIQGFGDHVGGLVGEVHEYDAHIGSSYNTGFVSGSGKYVGGLVGLVDENAYILTSSNTATVSGVRDVGGLIGRVVKKDTRINTAFNSGAISATGGDYAGGLVGRISLLNGFIENSYNVGSITGSEDGVGGLVGFVNQNAVVTSSYNAGTLSGNSTDGLFHVGGTAEISNAYTNVESTHVATSTPSHMKLASTYIGFDFTNTWGFASCTDNSGYPMLTAFGLVTSATEPDCSVPNGSLSSGGTAGATTPAPTYIGPMVTAPATTPVPGKPVVITGKKLSQVTQVTLGATSLTISAVTEESMTIQLPEDLEPGSYDLVIFSGQGKLTVMNFITITSTQIAPSSLGELLGYRWTDRFTGNSRTLSTAQERSITAALALFDADTVICWAYTTALIPNDWALAHATARAKSACDFVAETNPGLKTAVRVKYGVSKNAAMRASLQFWELENTN